MGQRLDWLSRFIVIAGLLTLASCARSPIKNLEQAMRLTRSMPALNDDYDFNSLVTALDANIRFLRSRAEATSEFSFGPEKRSKDEYLKSLEFLLAQAKQDSSGEAFKKTLRENFDTYEVYGQDDWGEIFMTAYFEPIISGAKKAKGRFTQPLYSMPKDLVVVDLDAFVATFPSLAINKERANEQRSRSSVLRGRLVNSGGTEPMRIVPFYERAQIDSEGLLLNQGLELAWVDPIDAFFLQIQGSGVVHFDDGTELRVGYAAQNGHPYVPIGKYLSHLIPKEKMSLQSIEGYLRSRPIDDMKRILNLNPSYVFFRPLSNAGLTFLGTEVVAGRTVATDQRYFPKGTLAFLEFERPVFATPADAEPVEWKKSSRFVLDQDTGGAIRGPHRLDLFWGRGEQARQAAGVMKNKGRLYYFVPRREFLQKL